jgi:hypothetical protein
MSGGFLSFRPLLRKSSFYALKRGSVVENYFFAINLYDPAALDCLLKRRDVTRIKLLDNLNKRGVVDFRDKGVSIQAPYSALNDIEFVIADLSAVLQGGWKSNPEFMIRSKNDASNAFDIGPGPRPNDSLLRW